MSRPAHGSLFYLLATLLVISAALVGCGSKQTGEAMQMPPLFLHPFPSSEPFSQSTPQPIVQSIFQATVQPSLQTTVQPGIIQPTLLPTPIPSLLGSSYDLDLDLKAGPVEVPFELQIPSLKVNAPVLGVGLILGNVMDAPLGMVGDPVWHTAFWYRGSSIPGDPGTATIAGHVTNRLGQYEIFGHLGELKPGDLIIIQAKESDLKIQFFVDEVKVYTIQESSSLAVLNRIFGPGPVSGAGPQPAADGLSHLTLITCGGDFVEGRFDSHTIVYATQGD